MLLQERYLVERSHDGPGLIALGRALQPDEAGAARRADLQQAVKKRAALPGQERLKAVKGDDLSTGDKIDIAASKSPAFKAGKSLKDSVKG